MNLLTPYLVCKFAKRIFRAKLLVKRWPVEMGFQLSISLLRMRRHEMLSREFQWAEENQRSDHGFFKIKFKDYEIVEYVIID